jgi:hypothetical protein
MIEKEIDNLNNNIEKLKINFEDELKLYELTENQKNHFANDCLFVLIEEVKKEFVESIINDILIIINKINLFLKININQFMLGAIYWMINQIYLKKDNFFNSFNLCYAIVICISILQKFYFETHHFAKDFAVLFKFPVDSFLDNEWKMFEYFEWKIFPDENFIINYINNNLRKE